MITFKLTGKWREAKDVTEKMAKRSGKAADMAVHGAAMSYRRRVMKAFVAQGAGAIKWHPLSMITLALRKGGIGGSSSGGSKALIRSGDTRKAVTLRKVARAHYFVGLHRTHGKYNIARVHEQPLSTERVFKIRVTKKMRRYFLYLFIEGIIPAPLKASTTHIVVKQRSFLQSVWVTERADIAKVAQERYRSVLMTGKVGKGRVR